MSSNPHNPPASAQGLPSWAAPALWLVAGLLPGLAAGVLVTKALQGGDPAAAPAPQEEAAATAPAPSATNTPLAGGSEPTAAPPASQLGDAAGDLNTSLLDVLRAEAAKMTPAQRIAELRSMAEEKQVSRYGNHTVHHASASLSRLMALLQGQEEINAALELLQNSPNLSRDGYGLQQATFMAWADLDRQGLDAWMATPDTPRTAKSNQLKAAAFTVLIQHWAREDPFAAWDKVQRQGKELADRQYEYSWMRTVISAAIEKNPRTAYQKAQQLTNFQEKSQALSQVLGDMAKTDWEGALRLAREQPELGISRDLEQNVTASYVQNNPGKAPEVLEQLLEESGNKNLERHNGLHQILYAWHNYDPGAAKAWVEQHAGVLGDSLGNLQQNFGNRHSIPLAKRVEEAEALTDKEARTSALNQVYSDLILKDPGEVARKLGELDNEDAQQNIGRDVASRLAEYDPKGAVEWVQKLPEKAQSDAMSSAMRQWLEINETSASSWLANQPPSKLRDTAIRQLVQKVGRSDPEAAALWAMESSDEQAQFSNLETSIRYWSDKDVEAAASWLKQQELPEKTRERLTSRIESKRKEGSK